MEKFKSTRGIIIDLREYPSVDITYLLAEYIIPKPLTFVKIQCDKSDLPGGFYYESYKTGAGIMKKFFDFRKFPFYNGKVMILMEQSSISNSELTIMALR